MIRPILRNLINTIKTVSMSTNTSRPVDKNLPEVKALLHENVIWLCNQFIQSNHEIRIVGGAVRDMLMKRKPKDVDLSTTATPDEMIKVFTDNEIKYIETGLQHGTLTAHIVEEDYEITTLRIDTETDGRRAVVHYTKDWYLDAQRRDLTVNAMSFDVDGMLYDYFNGEEDLKEKKIRFVGQADYRIKEDFLRILRYFRFYGKIHAETENHEEETLRVIKELSPGLKQIAVERMWMEVSKILTGYNAPHLVELMYKLDVAQNIGLPPCSAKHFSEFSKVWNNTQGKDPQAVTLLAALIDTVDQATSLCTHWKLSNFEKDLIVFIVSYRYMSVLPDTPLKPYQDFIIKLSKTSKGIDIVRRKVQELLNYEGKSPESEEIGKWSVPTFPITGMDLKNSGIKPGPDFGKVLNKLKEIWIESYYTVPREFLINEIDSVYGKICKR